jgi:hypothetical protein
MGGKRVVVIVPEERTWTASEGSRIACSHTEGARATATAAAEGYDGSFMSSAAGTREVRRGLISFQGSAEGPAAGEQGWRSGRGQALMQKSMHNPICCCAPALNWMPCLQATSALPPWFIRSHRTSSPRKPLPSSPAS